MQNSLFRPLCSLKSLSIRHFWLKLWPGCALTSSRRRRAARWRVIVSVPQRCPAGIRIWCIYQQKLAARRAQLAQLAARADQQHRWVLQGDERGVYGQYRPAALSQMALGAEGDRQIPV